MRRHFPLKTLFVYNVLLASNKIVGQVFVISTMLNNYKELVNTI